MKTMYETIWCMIHTNEILICISPYFTPLCCNEIFKLLNLVMYRHVSKANYTGDALAPTLWRA